jgi:hypothetical protein
VRGRVSSWWWFDLRRGVLRLCVWRRGRGRLPWPGSGPLVLDGADGQPQQFDHRVVVGEVATVFDDLAELIVQRLDAVGGIDDPGAASAGTRGMARETLPDVSKGSDGGGILRPNSEAVNASSSIRAASASAAW